MPANDILKGLADNPALMEAVKEKILAQFSYDEINDNQSNQEAGEAFRVVSIGRHKVEAAFREIAQHQSVKPVVDKPNPGY